MKKLVMTASLATLITLTMSPDVFAKPKKRSDYSKEQQAAIFKRALANCRKQYGERLHNVEVNYTKDSVICYIY